MNITFAAIHSGDSTRSVPLAAASIAAFAKKLRRFPLSFTILSFGPEDKPDKIAAEVISTKPDIAGFSAYSWCEKAVIETAAILRDSLEKIFLVAGGPSVTGNPAHFLSPNPFDAAVSGEGEEAFLLIMETFMREGCDRSRTLEKIASFPLPGISAAGFVSNTIAETKDLAVLESPWLSGFLKIEKGSSVLWESARGCPYRCAYCFESKGSKKVRLFPEERLVGELKLFASGGVSQVHVLDPAFNALPERADALLDLIAAHAPGIYFAFEARAETVTEATAKRLSKIFCSVQLGLESSNPEALAAVDRPFDMKKFSRGIGILDKHGIVFGFDLIYGLPCDSLSGFRTSVDFAVSLWPNHLDVFPLEIIQGTKLAETAIPLGLKSLSGPRAFVTGHPGFPEKAMAEAARIADGIKLLYNRGKAVPWFNQFLHAAKLKPWQAFLDFGKRMGTKGIKPDELEDLTLRQEILGFAAEKLSRAGNRNAVALETDIIRLGFAMADAVAGTETHPPLVPGLSILELEFDPEDLSEAGASDLALLAANLKPGNFFTVVWNGKSGALCRSVRRDLWDWLGNILKGKPCSNSRLEKKAKESGMLAG